MAPTYGFLSQPPPQKRRPTQPLPSPPHIVEQPVLRQRSSTFSAKISAWAAHVQPGSPAPLSPSSPYPIPSTSNRRRPSMNFGHSVSGVIMHNRVASSPFILTNTPTTASHKTFDFTALGYNTLFVNLPTTPATPSPLLREKEMREQALIEAKRLEKEQAKEESKERKGKVMKKIRSLTNLRSRSKSVSKEVVPVSPKPMPTSPTYTTATAPALSSKKSKAAPKTKKAPSKAQSQKKKIYGPLVRAPPTLQNELALMQFADGGKMEDHIRRVMVGPDGAVGDVYRDGKGGVWLDREEELEYRGLLVETDGSDEGTAWEEDRAGQLVDNWVQFYRDSPVEAAGRSSEDTLVAPEPTRAQKGKNVVCERRESALTLSTVDSDLDPAYLMQADQSPAYHDERVLNFDLRASSNAVESLKQNNARSKRNGMLLCLPARPFRAAKHLRKPEFIADLQAFGVVPKSPRSPLSPIRFVNAFNSVAAAAKPRGKARRRPAPLKISPAMTKLKRVVAVSSPASAAPPPIASLPPLPIINAHQLVTEGKREFMLDSFQPEVSKFDDDSECDPTERREVSVPGLKKRRGSRLDMRNLFGSGKRGDQGHGYF